MIIRDRLNKVIEKKGVKPKEMEELTHIDRMKWSNLKRKSIRATEEHIEAICRLFPEYAYWIVTGKEIPEVGQFSPEHEGMVH